MRLFPSKVVIFLFQLKSFFISLRGSVERKNSQPVLTELCIFNRLGNLQSQLVEGKVFNEKICCSELRSERSSGSYSDCLFNAINQIFSLKFTLTLCGVAGGFILP